MIVQRTGLAGVKEELWRTEHGPQGGANHFMHRLVLGVMRFCKRDKGFDFFVGYRPAKGLGRDPFDDVVQVFFGILGDARPVDAMLR